MKGSIKILFVEDVLRDAELIWRELAKNEIVFEKIIVDNSKDYITALKSFKPDLIISDFSLPQFIGMQALTLRNEMCPATPFILVTGSNNETVAVDCMKAGADDYILKDNLSRLAPAIQNALYKIGLLSEKNKSEKELKESEEKFGLVIKNIGEGVGILDAEEIFIFANPAADNIFGVGPGKLEGMNILRFLSPEGIELIRKQIVNRRNKESNSYEIEIILEDGNKKQLNVTATPKLDESGNFSGTFGIFRDISERKKAERTLHDLIDNNPISIQILDINGFTLKVNQAFFKLFGSVPPSDYSVFNDIQLKEKGFAELLEGIKNCEVVQFPDMQFNPHDSVPEMPDCLTWIKAIGFSLTDGNGKPEKIVLMHQDITARKLSEDALIKAKEKAEEGDRLKTAFLHNISHEIRTPMNAIVGFSGFLNDPGLLPEKRKQFTDIIIQSSDQLLSIITDIISIASIEAGQEKIQENEIKINLICKLIKEQFLPKASNKDVTLSLKTLQANDEVIIITDATKLTQIITNLLGNAFKFTQKGYINFGYTIKDNQLEFYVEDSGIGISSDMHDKIFNRFRQVETTDTRKFGGSGLGLSISKAYVEMLGGKMWLTSELGRGSVFYFTIPYKKANPNKLPDIQSIKDLRFEFKTPKTLLIAEDEDSNFTLLEELLSDMGINIIRAINGIEAVELCKLNPHINLVLMDIKMPEMDGYEATIRIKEFNPDLYIIAQTAYSTEADKNKAFACGCSDFMSKPLKIELLVSIINEQLLK